VEIRVYRTGSWTVKITDDVSHASLVAHQGSQVNWLLGVILINQTVSMPYPADKKIRSTHLGEGLDLSAVAGRALSRQETKGAVAGRLVL
jgi:hypothetical protein